MAAVITVIRKAAGSTWGMSRPRAGGDRPHPPFRPAAVGGVEAPRPRDQAAARDRMRCATPTARTMSSPAITPATP
jgi:hypothetical protein